MPANLDVMTWRFSGSLAADDFRRPKKEPMLLPLREEELEPCEEMLALRSFIAASQGGSLSEGEEALRPEEEEEEEVLPLRECGAWE